MMIAPAVVKVGEKFGEEELGCSNACVDPEGGVDSWRYEI